MRTINRNIVSALIYSSDGKLLMGKKDPNKGGVYIDCWHIPGGGIDENEDMIEALKREIYEETNILITKPKFIDNLGKGESKKVLENTHEKVICNMKFNVFKVEMDSISNDIPIKPKGDLIELEWFDINKLKDIKLTPPSQELFKRLVLI